MLSFFLISILFFLTKGQLYDPCGDYVWTLGDDELCQLHLDTFTENCTSFDPIYNISQTNGLAVNPDTGDVYIVASIGIKQGARELMQVNLETFELTTIGRYSTNAEKLAAIAFTCTTETHAAQLYGITGSQQGSDHSLYEVSTVDGTLEEVGLLDRSTKGNALTYSPYDDSLYRVGGTDTSVVDIEQIDYKTIDPNTTIIADEFIENIDKVLALGYANNEFLFLISGANGNDPTQILYLLNTNNATDLRMITMLNENRQHKGIICQNVAGQCPSIEFPDTTGATGTPATSLPPGDDDAALITFGINIYGIITFVLISIVFVIM